MPPKKVNNKKSKKPSFEERFRTDQKNKTALKIIAERAIREWPTLKEFNQALRYLEVFAQLMKLKPFLKWMIANIEVHDQVDHKQQTIDTIVVYKGTEKFEGEDEAMEAVDGALQTPERSEDQNIVCCPNCQITFDANVEAPRIVLADKVPS